MDNFRNGLVILVQEGLLKDKGDRAKHVREYTSVREKDCKVIYVPHPQKEQ